MLLLQFLVLYFSVGLIFAESDMLKANRRQVWKEFTNSMVEIYFTCKEEFLFNYEILTDVLEFWNTKHELRHTEYGCAFLCVGVKLEVIDNHLQFIIPNITYLLDLHGADPDMIKTAIELYIYCRNTIYQAIGPESNAEPCWIALEFVRCYRDGIEDMDWIPDVSELIPTILEKFDTFSNQRKRRRSNVKISKDTPLNSSDIKTENSKTFADDDNLRNITQTKNASYRSKRSFASDNITGLYIKEFRKFIGSSRIGPKKFNFLEWRKNPNRYYAFINSENENQESDVNARRQIDKHNTIDHDC